MSYRLYLDFKTKVKTIEDLATIINHLSETNHSINCLWQMIILLTAFVKQTPQSTPYSHSRSHQTPQLRTYYWPTYQLLGIPHSFTTPVQNKLTALLRRKLLLSK